MRAALASLVAALLAGCTDGGESDVKRRALEARVEQLASRLARVEGRVESTADLADDVRRLEGRVAAAEARASAHVAPAPTPPPVALVAPDRVPAPRRPGTLGAPSAVVDRRTGIAALREELRGRLAQIREQYGDDPASPERQQAMRELQRWYRERARALRGGVATGAEPVPDE